jgi:cyclase
MLAKRIIPCLDVRDGAVVKGVKFRDHEIVGDIVDLARRYSLQGADELVFYDITASPEGRRVDRGWVERVAEVIDIPFCVAGGISSLDDAWEILRAGADKISINTPALMNPNLINELADTFGSQCVVIGIDSLRQGDSWVVKKFTGNPDLMSDARWDTMNWIRDVQDRGAGEIVLNCMGNDGVRGGFDLEQLSAARSLCNVPLIASGGAGNAQHFVDVFETANVDGALAASVFHKNLVVIAELKETLRHHAIPIRI